MSTIFVSAALGLGMLACQLPFSQDAPQPPATSEPPSQAAPLAVSTLPPTYTPAPPPTQRPVMTVAAGAADLSTVKIQIQDLPPEFQELDAASQAQIGLTQEALGAYFAGTFTQAKSANYSAFLNAKPESFEVVLGLLFTPLASAEKAAFDQELSDPGLAMQTFTANFGGETQIIQGSDQLGEKSAGFTFLSQAGTLSMRGDLYLARRQDVAQLVLVLYQDGKQPPVPAAALAALLDARLKAAFNQ
jgi:hypothetical protein